MDSKNTIPFIGDTSTPEPQTIPFESTSSAPITTDGASLPKQVLEDRAIKNHIALGEKSPGPFELKKMEELGVLDHAVNDLAYGESVRELNMRVGLISSMAQNAAKQGRQLSDIERETIMGLSSMDMKAVQRDPETFLTQEYAKRVTSLAVARGVDNPLDWDPKEQEFGFQVMKGMEEFVGHRETFARLAQDTQAYAAKQGWFGYGVDVAKEFFPFYTWSKVRNAVEDYTGRDQGVSALLPGNNLEEQIAALYAMPLKDAHRLARQTLDGLSRDNPQLAVRFANALVSYGHANVDNLLIAGTDLATVGLAAPIKAIAGGALKLAGKGAALGAAKVAPQALSKAAGLAEKLKPVIQAISKREPSLASVADATGDTAQSAILSNAARIQKAKEELGRGGDIKSFAELDNQIMSTANPMSILEGLPITMSTESARRVALYMQEFADSALSRLLADPLMTARLGPEALKVASKEAFDTFAKQYRAIEDTILDVEVKNTQGAGIYARLGKSSGQLFDSVNQAKAAAEMFYGLPAGSYTIGERLNGAYLEMFRPFDLTSKGVRNARKKDIALDVTPRANTAIGQYMTKWRSADDVLPESVRLAFKQAVYGGSTMLDAIQKQARIMGKVKNPKDFMSFIKAQQIKPNPLDASKPGHFSRTIGEFEVDWANQFSRLPTEDEAAAYFAYTSINNTHYAFLNLSYYLDKTSRGLMQHFIPGLSAPLEGKIVHSLPTIKDEAATVLFFDESGAGRIFNTRYSTTPKKGETVKPSKLVDDLIKKEGYQITQLSDMGQMALKDLPEVAELGKTKDIGRVNFVVSKTVDSKPLSFVQIPHRPGGHHMTPEGFFVRQAQVYTSDSGRKMTYYGDTNIFQAPNEKAAKAMSEGMDAARKLLNDTFNAVGAKKKGVHQDQVTALEAYVKANLPISPKEFKNMFYGKNATLDPNVPIMYSVSDVSLDRAKDLKTLFGANEYVRNSDSQYNLYRGMPNMQYALERGDRLREAYLAGTKDNPLLGIRPGEILDPIAAMDRSMSSMRHGRYLENLRFDTSERFLAEFSDLLDLSNPMYKNDPFQASTSAPFKEARNLTREDQIRLNQAMAFRDRFKQFLGFRTTQEERVAYLIDKTLNGKSPDMVDGWRKPLYEVLSMPNPVDKLKSLAFHYKMGLWNPKHILLQANTMVHTMGILGPKIGTKASLTAMIQNFVLHSPDDLTEAGANLISKLGWSSKDEFMEAAEALRRSGYEHVGREVATREQHARARVVTTKAGDLLDDGLWFFKKGEQFVRRTSFNGAYLEWRAANPTAKMTDDVISRILDRADLLNVNMSQASNAAWQTGAMSIPSQFMSYQVRLTEQLWGSRLTAAEKRRLIGTYAAAYGVPVSTALLSFGMLPSQNYIKDVALSNGIDIEDNMILNTMNEGILGLMADAVFWEDNNFNVKYGPYGSSVLNDLMYGDKTGFELMMGASGSVLGEQIAAVAPVVPWLWRALNPYADENPPLSYSDFTDVFRPITTFSSTEKWIIGMKTGEYQTRKGYKVDDGNTGLRSFFYSYLGIQPQRIDDMYTLMGSRKDRTQFVSKIQDQISQDFEKMLKATSQDDAEYYLKRISARQAMLEPGEQMQAMRHAVAGRRSLMEKNMLYHRPKSAAEQDFNNSLYRKWLKNNGN